MTQKLMARYLDEPPIVRVAASSIVASGSGPDVGMEADTCAARAITPCK